jgi:hypothetical protein
MLHSQLFYMPRGRPRKTVAVVETSVVVPSGNYLGEIESISRKLNELNDDDDALIRLHEILYGNAGPRSTRKRSIRQWKGVKTEAKKDQIAVDVAVTSTFSVLKEICDILSLPIGDTRSQVENTISDFLVNPRATKDVDVPEVEPTVQHVLRKRGRKFGSKNKTPAQKEAERLAKLNQPRKRRGRARKVVLSSNKAEGEEKYRGRPRHFKEESAFLFFIQKVYPDIFKEWLGKSDVEKRKFWVKYKTELNLLPKQEDDETDVESPN